EKAASLNPPTGEVYNNMGICYRNMKMYEKAEENYKKAKSMGITIANYNIGILNLARGNYGDAITNFKASDKTCHYNMGLAYALNGEQANGQKAIDCMENKDKDAQAWYLKAIMAARAKDATNMTTYLKKCIQMDSKYKQIAMEDLEFLSYFKTNEFRAAVN
ncbi:MAG: tetratricopeptide repeat protein, partial [Bacteroidetes bacterium]|nr:tetratricopeptide repeat protein [Bacteroidota bacterium]